MCELLLLGVAVRLSGLGVPLNSEPSYGCPACAFFPYTTLPAFTRAKSSKPSPSCQAWALIRGLILTEFLWSQEAHASVLYSNNLELRTCGGFSAKEPSLPLTLFGKLERCLYIDRIPLPCGPTEKQSPGLVSKLRASLAIPPWPLS